MNYQKVHMIIFDSETLSTTKFAQLLLFEMVQDFVLSPNGTPSAIIQTHQEKMKRRVSLLLHPISRTAYVWPAVIRGAWLVFWFDETASVAGYRRAFVRRGVRVGLC
ncbi:hypothetical protein Pan241w_48420 [Gimesia alba]|uniref:Uncharacterized protein n=1 Tax=Gimesia alba TaxID=2527973 RepID=A0A517RLG8_9PLAN|nr:hypothetical protein Pan241w_48420 [Gimesia alba]